MPVHDPLRGPVGYDAKNRVINSGSNTKGIDPPSGMPDTTRPESGGQTKDPGSVSPTPSMAARPAQLSRRRSGNAARPVNADNTGRTPVDD